MAKYISMKPQWNYNPCLGLLQITHLPVGMEKGKLQGTPLLLLQIPWQMPAVTQNGPYVGGDQ